MKPLKAKLKNEIYARLLESTYRVIDGNNADHQDTEPQLMMDDSINVVEMDQTNRTFVIEVTRRIHFVPESIFDMTVRFGILRAVKNKVDFEWDKEAIEKEIAEDVDYFIGSRMDKASLMIACTTGLFGTASVITPPTFLTEDQSKEL